MSNYTDLLNEFGEEKLGDMLNNSAGEIGRAIDINSLKAAYDEIRDEASDIDYLDVMENDEDFFEVLGFSKKDIAFKVAMGDYNPHDRYVILDGSENIKSYSEDTYNAKLKEDADTIMKRYFDKLNNNEVEFIDDIYEPTREILLEYNKEKVVMKEFNLDNNITLSESAEVADDLDLYENETAYIVEKDGVTKGTITEWSNGKIDYYDYETNKDYPLEDMEDIVDIL